MSRLRRFKLGLGGIIPPQGVPASPADIKETEIDFGTDPFISSKVFNIIDPDISTSSNIIATKAIKTTSDLRDIDEIFAETLEISAKANNGSLDLYVNSVGSVTGKFIINYLA